MLTEIRTLTSANCDNRNCTKIMGYFHRVLVLKLQLSAEFWGGLIITDY